ncbi:hypothetical protein M011DRAFT_477967 [Sporormia fimetaria CBS 119925]|uniref:Uncharacterized protein n=1 Tax=Sporormia fimetaria CBS 119925 TaxID=1340428 RepID=A0A6A6VAL3_9PLEO|nr:hypothetical protein M011DRAFT_477967 [Sporormia fimetaria CBS 119925]
MSENTTWSFLLWVLSVFAILTCIAHFVEAAREPEVSEPQHPEPTQQIEPTQQKESFQQKDIDWKAEHDAQQSEIEHLKKELKERQGHELKISRIRKERDEAKADAAAKTEKLHELQRVVKRMESETYDQGQMDAAMKLVQIEERKIKRAEEKARRREQELQEVIAECEEDCRILRLQLKHAEDTATELRRQARVKSAPTDGTLKSEVAKFEKEAREARDEAKKAKEETSALK